MNLLAIISGRLERLSGRRMLYVPVCLGLGVGSYFALPIEPTMLAWVLTGLAAVGLAGAGARLSRGRYAGLGLPLFGLALVATGLVAGGIRSASVAAPVLDFRYYGPVEGRVVKIDRSA